MEVNSVDDLLEEIVDRTIEGSEAVYWKSDVEDDNNEPVLTVGAEPTKRLFRLRVGVSVERNHARDGIPDVLEASAYTDDFADDWFVINTSIGELDRKNKLEGSEFEFDGYDAGVAWYVREYTDNSLVSKLKSLV